MYSAAYSDTVTILCDEKGPVDTVLQGAGELRINSGCKGFNTSALLQSSFTVMSNVPLNGDFLTQIPLQYYCYVELGIKFNLSHLSLDVQFKQTMSHFDDVQYANIKASEFGKEIKEQEWKNHNLVKHNTYSVIRYIFLS
jgi:hypothetical protein